MGEIVGSIKGISKAASFLNTPIVSGNVSLYNETNGKGILPTPVIGMVGVIDEVENCLEMNAQDDNTLVIEFLIKRNNFMSKKKIIYEGKAKTILEGPTPDTVIQYFKDDATLIIQISAKAIPIPPSDTSLHASIKFKSARFKINLPCFNSSLPFQLIE